MKINTYIKILVLVLILTPAVIAGCIRGVDKEYGGHGEILSIGVYKPKLLDNVVYSIQNKNYVITPQEDGFKIAAVRVRAVNQTSAQAVLSIDENAVTLLPVNGTPLHPIVVHIRAEETAEEVSDGNPYGAHLWGTFQLMKGFEVSGWFFFDVAPGSSFTDIIWEDVEYIRVPYRD